MKLFLLLSFLLLSTACQRHSGELDWHSGDSGIVGGNFVGGGTTLARQVAFVRAGLKCSGTFIARNVVLTSAHCFTDGPKRSYYVGIGVDSRKLEFKTKVTKVILHPLWKSQPVAPNDLALVKTETSLPARYLVTQLYSFDVPQFTKVVAAGFGRDTYTKTKGSAGRLKFTSLVSDPDAPIHRNFRISMNAKSGMSFGDSGGPLFVEIKGRLVQYGVAHGIYRDPKYFRAEYTAIRGNSEWIDDTRNSLAISR